MSGDRFEFDDGSGVGRLTGTLHDPQATPGDVLTVQPDGSVSAAPGGGSMPVQSWTFSFDTPGLSPQAFPITAVDQEAQTFTIAGDHAELFPIGVHFSVSGSTGNDGNSYVISDVAVVDGNTIVTCDGSISDGTVDGNLNNCGTAGVELKADPALFLYAAAIATTAFDGSLNPALSIGPRSGILFDYFAYLYLDGSPQVQDSITSPSGMTEPLWVLLTNDNDQADDSTQGEVVLTVWSAP